MRDISADAPGPQRELDLTPDRLPKTLWLVAGIPAFTASLLFWLTAHWHDLSYRGYIDDPDWRWRLGAYDGIVRAVLSFLVFDMWLVAYGLAHWYGVPRTNSRDARLNLAIANAWFIALLIPAIQLSVTLDLAWPGIALCAAMAIVGVAAVIAAAIRVRDQDQETNGQSSRPGVYFDRQDPALAGPRGLNLGNPWQWVLWAAGLLPSVVTFLLLRLQLR